MRRFWVATRWIWAGLAALALLLGLLADFSPALDVAGDVGEWLGDHPEARIAVIVIAALVLAVVLILLGRRTATWGTSAGHRDADQETYKDLIELLPRNVIEFFREHDFGNSWSGQFPRPVYEFVETRKAVEYKFHDRAIERKRERLHAACEAFVDKLAGYSHPGHNSEFFELNEKEWVRSNPPGDETYRRFEAHRQELGELADAMVVSYDELVEVARKRLPGI
ncbi:MAG: hypothetical protein R2725_07145 [Solirubrobacterales bacterium]